MVVYLSSQLGRQEHGQGSKEADLDTGELHGRIVLLLLGLFLFVPLGSLLTIH